MAYKNKVKYCNCTTRLGDCHWCGGRKRTDETILDLQFKLEKKQARVEALTKALYGIAHVAECDAALDIVKDVALRALEQEG